MGPAILAAVVGFVVLEAAAAWLYPGGTWWDRTTVGYRFWQNYLCDLEWRVAINGQNNEVGARLAQTALIVLLGGLGSFWVAVPSLFAGRRRLGAWVKVLGVGAVVGSVAVALMPSDRFPTCHGLMVILAGVPGVGAAALAAGGLLAPGTRWPGGGRLGASLFVVALADLGLYALHWATGSYATPLLPAIQKVGLVLLLAWMTGVALRVMRPRSGAS